MSAVAKDGALERTAAEDGALPLALESVSFALRGKTLIDSVSARIDPGPFTIIMGPNGAGKSLLLRLCHGLLEPTRGRIVWLGPRASEAWRRQAMVFQRPVLLRRSVRANVTYALAVAGVSWRRRRELAEAALARVGLSWAARQPARTLSGGEQQRLALARAWALKPEVLFLDEPTASLDPAGTAEVERIVRDFHEAGTKIVMTTHDLGQAQRLADEVWFLHAGRLVEQAKARDFFAAPRSREAAAFVRGELLW